jgi:hypothetical protein
MNAPSPKMRAPAGIVARAKRIEAEHGRAAALKYFHWHCDRYLRPAPPTWPPELAQIVGEIFLTFGADIAEEFLACEHPDLDRCDPLSWLQATAQELGLPVPWRGLPDE